MEEREGGGDKEEREMEGERERVRGERGERERR